VAALTGEGAGGDEFSYFLECFLHDTNLRKAAHKGVMGWDSVAWGRGWQSSPIRERMG
jgi:hypothetical protein